MYTLNNRSGVPMSKGKELAKNTIIIAIGKISTQFISFFLLPLYTSMLSTHDYGIVDIFNIIIALALPMITLQVEQAIFRYLVESRNSEKDKKEIITLSMYFVSFVCIVYPILFLIIQNFIKIQFKEYIIINVIANAFSIMLLQVARGLGKMVAYSIGSFISAISTIVLNVIFLVCLRMGIEGMLLATFLGNFLCSVYLFINLKIWKYIHKNDVNMTKFVVMLKYSIPLVPHAISWWIVNASDRIIITFFLGVSVNGLIAVAHKFPTVFLSIFNIFSLSWTESGTLHLKEQDGQIFFEKMLQTSFNIFLAGFLVIVSFMPFAFPILVDRSYADAYYQIPIFMLATLFSIVVGLYNVVYTTYLVTKEIMKTTIFAGVVNVIVSLVAIQFIGIYAASVATAVAYGIMAIYRYYDSRKYVTLKLDGKVLLSGVFATVIVFFAYYIRDNVLCWGVFAGVSIYCIIINRKFIHDIVHTFDTFVLKIRRL